MSDSRSTARFPHLSILASAGAGKTYQLTSRYLALLASGAGPGTILASTFTRLAAGEIRDRVLLRLAQAADDDDQRRALAADIKTARLGQDDVRALLRALTRNLHRLQMRTLDSFFASVVRSFAIELGLPRDCRWCAFPI
ncbi:MAG: UvrD-helicase domain-containing protein [Planctomycetota bacterium]|nr:UvrD-helicase domain-containing protein [Planctomycetota bacterium]